MLGGPAQVVNAVRECSAPFGFGVTDGRRDGRWQVVADAKAVPPRTVDQNGAASQRDVAEHAWCRRIREYRP